MINFRAIDNLYKKYEDNIIFIQLFTKDEILYGKSYETFHAERYLKTITENHFVCDFEKNIIKPHEKIYQNRKVERADQMMNIKTQIGPIYVSYTSDKNLSNFLISKTKNPPLYDFESFDKSK